MGKLLKHIAGWVLLLLGVAGLVLPVLQGWLLIAIGALLLAPDMPIFARLILWLEQRFPAVRGALRRARGWLGGGSAPRG